MKFNDILGQTRIQLDDFSTIEQYANGTHVDVGTFRGGSALAAHNADKVWTIDVYEWLPHLWENILNNITFYKGTSEDFVKNYPDIQIDSCFIDGAHEYDYVCKDIDALAPKVKKGGIIMCHDYNDNNEHGVKQAVNEGIEKYGLKIIKYPSIGLPPPHGSSIVVIQK